MLVLWLWMACTVWKPYYESMHLQLQPLSPRHKSWLEGEISDALHREKIKGVTWINGEDRRYVRRGALDVLPLAALGGLNAAMQRDFSGAEWDMDSGGRIDSGHGLAQPSRGVGLRWNTLARFFGGALDVFIGFSARN